MLRAMQASRGWFFVSLLLAGCARREEARLVPLPEQRVLENAPDLPFEPAFVRMSEARSAAMIVREIVGEGHERWTGPNPAMRFKIPAPGEWRAEVRFRAAETTLKSTGPVTLAFAVNGRPIGSVRVGDPAVRTFSAIVLLDRPEAEFSFTVDKPWVSPEDGAKLGVLLQAMGFRKP